jgi:hypothetical protein
MAEAKSVVYVFGAGASVDVGGPLAKDFLYEGFSLLTFGDRTEFNEERFYRVGLLIEILYKDGFAAKVTQAINNTPISKSDFPNVTLEELLTYVDLAIARGEDWLDFKKHQQDLYNFIFETLEYNMKSFYSDVVKNNPDGTLDHWRNNYDKLIDYVINPNDRNCFITFNYDLFLDGAVTVNNYGLVGDYNLPFSSTQNFSSYDRIINSQREDKDVDILKLHGSMNWTRCLNCGNIYLKYHNRYRFIFNEKCPSCNNFLSPILVPPTFRKNIESYGIINLWDKADDLISKADQLIIIGYSFPDADLEAKWLFKKALVKGNKRPSLTIVDPSNEIQNKIKGFFSNTISDVDHHDSFNTYIDSKINKTTNTRL